MSLTESPRYSVRMAISALPRRSTNRSMAELFSARARVRLFATKQHLLSCALTATLPLVCRRCCLCLGGLLEIRALGGLVRPTGGLGLLGYAKYQVSELASASADWRS